MTIKTLGAGALLALASVSAFANGGVDEVLRGRVVGVADGDTLTLLQQKPGARPVERRIRLAGIDAPERAQPFGSRSRQELSRLCFRQEAEVDVEDVDRYGRVVGHVSCQGQPANLMMVESGMAWAYVQYDPPKPYIDAEQAARDAGRGLWADPDPTPPWEWRREQRRR